MSHDLRGPLSTIATACEILELDLPAERHANARAAIRRAVRRMEGLISDLVDVARIDAGALDLQLEGRHAGRILSQLVDLLRDQADGLGVRLDQVVEHEPMHVMADDERLLQALASLLEVALTFVHRGGSLQVAAAMRGGWVQIALSGTAPGLDPELLPALFHRSGLERGLRASGSRLGLVVAEGIVRAHGGCIDVAANDRQGTTFTISLPAVAGGAASQ